ncbi:MAG: alpha-2-macroglobulin family protein [Paludibacter sp.]|nr:alpha-2-macroglobulin family protein [Paludibacter sp.]
MKKSFAFILISTVFLTVFLAAQKKNISIESRWKAVKELADKQLPESALKEVESILDQAQREKNSVEVIKAMVYKMRFTLDKNPDEAPVLIKNFEDFTETCTDPAERALLHSMTAELYAQYYQKDQWTINRRTEVVGYVPEDMKEWTKNIYFDKISKHLAASMENPAVLQQTSVLKFAALLEKGDDSRTMQPTLFDFLGNRRISILKSLTGITSVKNPLTDKNYFADAYLFITLKSDLLYNKSIENQIIETYQQLLAFRLKASKIGAFMNLNLERLDYFRSGSENESTDSLYLSELNRLIKTNLNNEIVVEVLAEKANYYYQQSTNNDGADEICQRTKNFKRLAYNICSYGIQRFPKYKRIGLLINIKKLITKKDLNITYKEVTNLSSNIKVKINSSNISSLQLSVYRVNATALEYYNFKENNRNNSVYPSRILVETRQITIKSDPDFGNVKTNILIKPKDYGIYDFCLELKNNKKVSHRANGTFTVTDFAIMNRKNKPDIGNLYALNSQTGIPQSNIQVELYTKKWMGSGYDLEHIITSKTNEIGLCTYPLDDNNSNDVYFLKKGKDVYFTSDSYFGFNSRKNLEGDDEKINLFTDRSLYRPGQIVYFKAIAFVASKKRQIVLPNKFFNIVLVDANNKTVTTKSFTTNDFGSISGEFILPEGRLNGVYRILAGTTSLPIWVEEYKRPTFEVLIDKPKKEIQFGDSVKISGSVKAYAGFNIADASIKYRVVRRVHRYCWWFNEPEEEITNGTTKSTNNGAFEVSFVPARPKSKSSNYVDKAYTYTLYVDVTDPKGETQQGEKAISVGDKSLFIITEIPEKIKKDESFSFEIETATLNDDKVNSIIKYSVFRLNEGNEYDENIDENKNIKVGEKVLSGNLNTKDKKQNVDFKQFKSGKYKFTFTTLDAHGREVKLEKTFILYGTEDKRPPIKTYMWLLTPKTECEVGETARIQFGTSTENSMLLYEIMNGNTVLESSWIPFSNEIKTFDIPFKESYGAGVTVMFTFMKDEQLFTKSIQLTRKEPEKKLTPTFSVFRNKLLPGEKAEWTVTIPECAKNKKVAELMVDMYDASLDALRLHNWYFNPTYRESVLYAPLWKSNSYDTRSDYMSFNIKYDNIKDYQFDVLNWFGLDIVGYYSSSGMRLKSGVRFAAPVIKKDEEVLSIADVKGKDNSNGRDIADYETIQTEAPVQIRTNFNETAFFYPQLRTDSAGNVKFAFTAPESLTRWNVMMLAHTQDLYFGQGEAQVITQKDLMVQMNLPRFVRRSDKLVLSANVTNLTDSTILASVQFEMINPETGKLITIKDAAPKKVTLAANQTKAVEWRLSEFSLYELVTCKVVARAGNFSDGEQKYLPVLPDKVLVTESMPLTIRGNQTRSFNFESLLKNESKVDTKNLTVEFSSNPAWYAVQALPTISTPENDNTLDYFTAYYANTLAAFIANSNPKIATTFERWKNAGGSREALNSNLEKNAELKNMLLDETPWVMAAKNETEQKRQIALLFDLNMQKNQAQQYLDKLISLQLPSGGFPWFKGMTESRYITQKILLNLGRLNRMTGQSTDNKQQLTVKSALHYLDLEITRDFDNLKKYNKNYEKEMCVDNMQLFYLHVRSEFQAFPIDKSALEAAKFYTAQSEKYWTELTLYGKAMMAVVAERNGKTDIAIKILKSLKENALKTDEFGMYWAKNTPGYFWNEQPIAVQAAIIEAFSEINKNSNDIEEMKIWMLKQKQTQRWNSPMATVEAIYTLLNQGSDWLANEGSVKINVGNTTLQPASTEAGTGYFKETIPVNEITPETAKVTVRKLNSGTGWGAMYWQYYQDLDKIESQNGPLKITKKLFVEKMTISVKTLVPIEQTEIKKGDKVITRLVITTDRNLEFVTLKDLRASCFEPVNQLSGCDWKEGVCYFKTTKDASTQFFFSYLPKGTYVFEYELWANNCGEFTSGIASVQCQYAPDFVSHTGGELIKIN